MTVQRRRMGRTGIDVSVIGFGTGDNAGCMVLGDDRDQQQIVGEALDSGINYFDCSPDYGRGLAEANLGRVLRQLGRADEVVVTTKVEIMPEHIGMMGTAICESVKGSLIRLRRDWVDVLMVHNSPAAAHDPAARKWTPLTPDDILGECLAGLAQVQQAGKARYLGIACESADPVAADRVLASGYFDVANLTVNMLNPADGWMGEPRREGGEERIGLLASARRHGVAVSAIRPLAGGVLTRAVVRNGVAGRHQLAGKGLLRDRAAFDRNVAHAIQLADALGAGGTTIEEDAYRFVLACPGVTTVLGGFSCMDHLRVALRAAAMDPLGEDDLAAIRRVRRRQAEVGR